MVLYIQRVVMRRSLYPEIMRDCVRGHLNRTFSSQLDYEITRGLRGRLSFFTSSLWFAIQKGRYDY